MLAQEFSKEIKLLTRLEKWYRKAAHVLASTDYLVVGHSEWEDYYDCAKRLKKLRLRLKKIHAK